ncbi:hypothetical protein ACA910_019622 [Epithemia clementina (nom. ined.)]
MVEESDEEGSRGLAVDDEEADPEERGNDMMFSSQVPESSQEIAPVRAGDRNNLNRMDEETREKVIGDLLELVLFKGLAREPIDRQKAIKEAGISDARISSAVFTEVNNRLQNIFDFKLAAVPAFLLDIKDFPNKYKDRYYLLNTAEDPEGSHSRELHSASHQGILEKGLLMVVLAFIFCKGEPRSDGTRWLLETDLYSLLHSVDENIHSEPPVRNSRTLNNSSSRGVSGSSNCPDVDLLLHKFVQMDYLWAVKDNEQLLSLATANGNNGTQATTVTAGGDDANTMFYSMGPRALLEIGRKQVIHFCAELLDEEPDPSMYEGIDDELNGDDGLEQQ